MIDFHTLDVFTTAPYAGNPLAVVLGADHLSTAQMQTIAREFNLSETIFVRRPADPAHSAEVRIFFPTAEIPFAGHPTIGCAILLAQMAQGDGDWVHDIKLEEQAGLVPVRVVKTGDRTSAEFVAPVIPHAHPGQVSNGDCAAALGLSETEIGFSNHAPGVWAGGPAFLYIPVADADALARARPMEPDWSALMAAGGVDSAYLYTPSADGGYQARMFSPGAGIPEDPATGSASAILAAQLLAAGELGPGTTEIPLRQGVEMGRPSDIGLTVTRSSDGAIGEVRIKGAAVRISHGQISPPKA
ncbi:PhzF family phenazine biosynthesis protein [Flavimaricola marinus]|uniref:Trans-2,3-dihydro-3-hydroxyanthranilate isomerase n=1 Tax=Flavimaricola marinus TaxID=1819565 RepID=A0A238LKM8_9RHOB|nr:PhzF family phenazine biosynthesis protein [Flavimaricola marinus]SMY09506.1 Trans-2,3-dihydro-3-hydroxyanthranilate isomerase [Flavimaricola marinus]